MPIVETTERLSRRRIEHKSPLHLQMVKTETIRHGKHVIERVYYVDERGREHVKTINRSKFF
jgi:hypothetical protein